MISKRTKAALAEAKRRGTKLGNPRFHEATARAVAAHRARGPAPEVTKPMSEWRAQGKTLRASRTILTGSTFAQLTGGNSIQAA